MQLTLKSVVLCTLTLEGALALPSAHVHHHHHARGIESVDFNNKDLYSNVNWKEALAKPAGDAPVVNAQSSKSVSGSDSTEHSTPEVKDKLPVVPQYKPKPKQGIPKFSDQPADVQSQPKGSGTGSSKGEFCLEDFGKITKPIANGNVDQYIGNVGSPHGSNIIKAAEGKNYKYTNTFVNKSGKDTKVVVWNKSGPDGRPNSGQFSKPCLEFDLASGAEQTVAFDENSQVAFCPDSGKRTSFGAYDCTYGEADFGNLSNKGWSGYDISAIQNTAGNQFPMQITCPNGATSSNKANGYVSDAQPGGIGGNLPPGPVVLKTIIG